MTDDLVKRLRDEEPEFGLRHSIAMEAADRIEQLEAALRKIADGPRDVDKSYISLFHEIQYEARKALEGEK